MLVLEGELWIRPGKVVKKGQLLIDQGYIQAVGEDLDFPKGTIVHSFTHGEKILPGFVEPHCHLGVYEEITGAERLNRPGQLFAPDFRVLDGMNFLDLGLYDAAISGGVTTACILPGSAALVGGLGAIVKTGGVVEVIENDCCLKVALGENVEKPYNLSPQELHKALDVALLEAQEESILGQVREGKLQLRVHCHRQQDIEAILALKQKYALRLVIEHGTEAHRCLDFLADSGASLVVGPFFVGRPKEEMKDPRKDLAALLTRAGVEVSLMSDYPSNPPDMLRQTMLEAIRFGIDEVMALDMVTLGAARLLGIEDRVGSLEVGKDGDVVVHSASPFDYRDKIIKTYIKGEEICWPNMR